MKYKDNRQCKCGGRIKMSGFENKHFVYKCNKCKGKYLIAYISK